MLGNPINETVQQEMAVPDVTVPTNAKGPWFVTQTLRASQQEVERKELWLLSH